MGGAPAVNDHAGVQSVLWQAGAYPIGRFALPGLLLQRAASVDVLLRCTNERDEQSRRKSVRDHEGLFPALDPAYFCGALGPGGFCRFIFDVCRHHDLLPHARDSSNAVAATVFAAGSADGARRWAVALGTECDLSRRTLCGSLPSTVLDVRFAGSLSQFARSAQVASALRFEPDGGRN